MAGLIFLLKAGGGLYWLILAVAGLLGGVLNAWLFLVRVSASPAELISHLHRAVGPPRGDA